MEEARTRGVFELPSERVFNPQRVRLTHDGCRGLPACRCESIGAIPDALPLACRRSRHECLGKTIQKMAGAAQLWRRLELYASSGVRPKGSKRLFSHGVERAVRSRSPAGPAFQHPAPRKAKRRAQRPRLRKADAPSASTRTIGVAKTVDSRAGSRTVSVFPRAVTRPCSMIATRSA